MEQIPKIFTYSTEFKGYFKENIIKNVIPVMLNKFTKWLDSLICQEAIQDMVKTIANIRRARQNIFIRDLRHLCREDNIQEYWIRFLYDGHAKESIKQMKLSTNKSLYEKQIDLLLREIQNPAVRGQPYKNFISLTKNSLLFMMMHKEIKIIPQTEFFKKVFINHSYYSYFNPDF